MKSSDRSALSRLLSLALVTACCQLSQPAFAQENKWPPSDPLELIRTLPPDIGKARQILGTSAQFTFDLGRRMLEWQIQQGERNEKHLDREIHRLRSEIHLKDAEIFEVLKQQSPATFRFATDAVREQLIGQVLERKLNAELEIAANRELIEHLEQQVRSPQLSEVEKKQAALRNESFNQREQAIRKLHKLMMSQLETRETQRKLAGTATQDDIIESRIRIEQLEAELVQLQLENKLSDSAHEKVLEVAQNLTDAQMETHRLEGLVKAAQRQLDELAKAADSARKVGSVQREIDQLEERLKLRAARYEQVQMETEEIQLLLNQVDEALKQSKPPAGTEDAPPK